MRNLLRPLSERNDVEESSKKEKQGSVTIPMVSRNNRMFPIAIETR
jgi:hypothetical protein